mmetsp:Transcript_1514/g.4310  ORF Transcript_1514/g.4310 Transcript_1514/m.4310 type:complete len:367 (+) Transcript_1514:161-1261(+)
MMDQVLFFWGELNVEVRNGFHPLVLVLFAGEAHEDRDAPVNRAVAATQVLLLRPALVFEVGDDGDVHDFRGRIVGLQGRREVTNDNRVPQPVHRRRQRDLLVEGVHELDEQGIARGVGLLTRIGQSGLQGLHEGSRHRHLVRDVERKHRNGNGRLEDEGRVVRGRIGIPLGLVVPSRILELVDLQVTRHVDCPAHPQDFLHESRQLRPRPQHRREVRKRGRAHVGDSAVALDARECLRQPGLGIRVVGRVRHVGARVARDPLEGGHLRHVDAVAAVEVGEGVVGLRLRQEGRDLGDARQLVNNLRHLHRGRQQGIEVKEHVPQKVDFTLLVHLGQERDALAVVDRTGSRKNHLGDGKLLLLRARRA